MKTYSFFLLSIICALVFVGCSGGGDQPIAPPTDAGNIFSPRNADSGRELLGLWQINIDPVNLTITIIPLRNAENHINITNDIMPPNCEDCVFFDFQGYDEDTWVTDLDITLKDLKGEEYYDVRGIFFTDDFGTELTNPDDWTDLWDFPKGDFKNPFIAFAKEEPQRLFPTGIDQTEEYLIYSPLKVEGLTFLFAVDVSWQGNCTEPYSIEPYFQDPIYNTLGDGGVVEVEVKVWQGNVEQVILDLPPEMAMDSLMLTSVDGIIWSGYVTNVLGAGPGIYNALVTAISDGPPPNFLYDFVPITIIEDGTSGRWARTWGGLRSDKGQKTGLDAEGNIYVYGDFRHIADFDPGLKFHYINTKQGNYVDFFLSKFDSSGILQWVRTLDGAEDNGSRGLAVDSDGNSYVTGSFLGTVDLALGPEEFPATSNGGGDVFLVKFDSNGKFLWADSWGGEYDDGGRGVAIANTGYIYVVGGNVVVDNEPGVTDDIDIYVRKYSTAGVYQWDVKSGGDFEDAAMEVATDSLGDIYVVGLFQSTFKFDPSEANPHSSNGIYDAFICKIDSSDTFQWARTWGGWGWDKALDVATDGSSNIYITGYFSERVIFDPDPGGELFHSSGEKDAYLCKYDPTGDFKWVVTLGGPSGDWGRGVTTDVNDDIYLTGGFADTVVFGSGPGETITSFGSGDAFLIKYDPSSALQWIRTWGSDKGDMGRSVAVDTSGNSYVTGWFGGPTDFDPGPGMDYQLYLNGADVFLTKLDPGGF